MNTHIADVIIHTRNTLSERQFAHLVSQVYREDGVVSVSRNPHTPRFLMVVYNAARIRAKRILDAVIAEGHPASLVGI